MSIIHSLSISDIGIFLLLSEACLERVLRSSQASSTPGLISVFFVSFSFLVFASLAKSFLLRSLD
ncbi:hypothetical protein BDW59DRAFT_138534 [Aspergillus cavernicola]|uniref:Uncharacterized protein n=1 Tax=Aspergillus cavernicola TaxID=176166 RepID=A0ABR4J012_9EURO